MISLKKWLTQIPILVFIPESCANCMFGFMPTAFIAHFVAGMVLGVVLNFMPDCISASFSFDDIDSGIRLFIVGKCCVLELHLYQMYLDRRQTQCQLVQRQLW